jgi:short-subunit dehydrogenase
MNSQKVAIVTGGSSGIGMETALELARRGYAVFPAARRADRLEALAERIRQEGGLARPMVADVTEEAQVRAVVEAAVKEFGRLDVMVNNAGVGLFSRVHQITNEQMRAIFEVNFHGLFYGCKAAAEVMMRQRSGHIFNVSSVIGKRGTPFHGGYCATKFAVCGLTESMRVELAPYHVLVTLVCPVLTETEFFEHSLRGQAAKSSFTRLKGLMPAAKVARKMARTVGKNKPELIFSFGGRLLVAISCLWPALADRMMMVYYKDLAKKLTVIDQERPVNL